MHCLAQWAAASSATAPAMRAAEPVTVGRLVAVPSLHAAAASQATAAHCSTGDQHVGQRVLDRLELADGPAELHPHLGVLRRRLEAPAGDPRALRRGRGPARGRALRRRSPRTGSDSGTGPSPSTTSVPTGRVASSGQERPRPTRRSRGPPGRARHQCTPSATGPAARARAAAVGSPSTGRTVPLTRSAPAGAVARRQAGCAPSATAAVMEPSARPGSSAARTAAVRRARARAAEHEQGREERGRERARGPAPRARRRARPV